VRAQYAASQLSVLLQVLAAAGIDSRRACERIIEEGRVKVNGKVVTSVPTHVRPTKDQILVDGTGIQAIQRKHYFMVHKPKGYVCSTNHNTDEDVPGKPVEDLLQPFIEAWKKNRPVGAATPRLFTVGRLDQTVTGLMLVTNDGIWAQKVSHPKAGAEHASLAHAHICVRCVRALTPSHGVPSGTTYCADQGMTDADSGWRMQGCTKSTSRESTPRFCRVRCSD
jgi:16S rRNA U516 pseudouridylate synthase RsuA-like enzyme